MKQQDNTKKPNKTKQHNKTDNQDKVYKADLIKLVSHKTNISGPVTSEVVNALFDIMTEQMQKQNTISIFGFGSFHVVQRKPRNGVNPSTREHIVIPARLAVTYKSSNLIKESLNNK